MDDHLIPLASYIPFSFQKEGCRTLYCGSWYISEERRGAGEDCQAKCCPFRLYHAVPFCLLYNPVRLCLLSWRTFHLWKPGNEWRTHFSNRDKSITPHLFSSLALTSPRPDKQWHPSKLQMSLTQSKALYTSIQLQKLSEIKEKH